MIIFKDTVQMLAPLENQSKFPRSSSFPSFSFLLPFYLGICFLIKLYRLHENRGHILFILGSHSRFPSTGTDDLQPCWILYLWLNPIKKCMYMYSFSYFTVAQWKISIDHHCTVSMHTDTPRSESAILIDNIQQLCSFYMALGTLLRTSNTLSPSLQLHDLIFFKLRKMDPFPVTINLMCVTQNLNSDLPASKMYLLSMKVHYPSIKPNYDCLSMIL